MRISTVSPVPARLNLVVLGLIVALIIFYTSFRVPSSEGQDEPDLAHLGHDHSQGHRVPQSSPNDRSIYRVQNETLGFEKIYMISLPGRSDKRDAFAMQAAFSDMTYTQMDGVYGDEVPVKALPHVRLLGKEHARTDR